MGMRGVPTDVQPSLAVKLGSLVTHVLEATGPGADDADLQAAATVCEDPEVVAWLVSFDPALLPVMRGDQQ